MLTVYVPVAGSRLESTIDPRSGIVGSSVESDPSGSIVRIDYEGARYTTGTTFADRVAQAAGRHTTQYPTVARAWARATELVAVGRWDDTDGTVLVENTDELVRWLQVDQVSPTDLLATGARYEQRRAYADAMRSPDPAVRRFAAEQARRFGLDL